MIRKVGIRELKREALNMAAAMVRDADFESLFGDELMSRICDQEGGDELMAQAQHYAVERIESLIPKPQP